MIARLTGGAALVAIFLVLLPDPRPLDVLLAVLVAAGALVAVGPTPLERGTGPRSLLALPRLLAWIVKDVATGTVRVAAAVIGVRPPRSPRAVRVELGPSSEQALVLTGVLLTISPGSVLIDADTDAGALDVHVVDGDDPDRVQRQVRELHDLVLRAVGG